MGRMTSLGLSHSKKLRKNVEKPHRVGQRQENQRSVVVHLGTERSWEKDSTQSEVRWIMVNRSNWVGCSKKHQVGAIKCHAINILWKDGRCQVWKIGRILDDVWMIVIYCYYMLLVLYKFWLFGWFSKNFPNMLMVFGWLWIQKISKKWCQDQRASEGTAAAGGVFGSARKSVVPAGLQQSHKIISRIFKNSIFYINFKVNTGWDNMKQKSRQTAWQQQL